MKKLLLIPALLGTMALATEYNYEITPLIGYNIAEGNLNLDNDTLVGLEAQFNDVDSVIKPEFSILHSGGVKSENTLPTNTTNITRLALNGVYEFGEDNNDITPFVKAGAGYETISRSITNNSDGVFVDAGAGVKIPFTEALALKLEALYMLKHNDNSAGGNWGDSNLALLAGLNYSFGEKAGKAAPVAIDGDDDNDGVLNSADKCPTTPAGHAVNAEGCLVDGDDDNDGVLNTMDKCPTTPAGQAVNTEGCSLDSDNDGVLNTDDKCPTTPAGEAVNAEGCPIIINLHVNFNFDSYEVDAASKVNVKAFADFLNKFPAYNANIVGHTDNQGPATYNLQLSSKRADVVKALLVEQGVSADRVNASGEGETNPVTTNNTKEDRAQNRRIEAELVKN